MTILPQLERDLFNAAEERLRPDAAAPQGRSGSPPSSVRARFGRAAAGVPVIVSVAVTIAIALVAIAVLSHGRHASQSASPSGPSGGSSRAELIRALGVLRRPQTKADLQGLERLDRVLKVQSRMKGWVGPRLKESELDRRLARVVNVPAWRAQALIAPTRSQPSPASGRRSEGVELVLLWPKTAFGPPSVTGPGPTPASLGAVHAHGLAVGPVVPRLDVGRGVVRGPDVEDGVLLVPDGVTSVKLGLARSEVSVGGLKTKALNAALAAIHATAAVHDNIAAFQVPIPVYTGRPPPWSGPGPIPKYWFSGIGTTFQDTWYDARGRVVSRTTTEIVLAVRIPARAASR